ncbi:MAG: DUF1080 domain-containing protein [Bacteroidota bacterium]
MKNQLIAFVLALCIAACQPSQSGDQAAEKQAAGADTSNVNMLTEEEKAASWKLLFDGKSTDQWRAYNQSNFPALGWVVKDGMLVIEKTPHPKPAGFGGDIITKEQFGNFELSLDFMITDTSNSGILYLAIEEKDSAIWHNAPEYQILDNETWSKMGAVPDMATHRTGDNYDLHAAPADYMKPKGYWNNARILHKDGHVEHWLNGNKTVEYQIGSPEWTALVKKSKFNAYPMYGKAKQGHIGLQDHDHEVRFRNLKIRSW